MAPISLPLLYTMRSAWGPYPCYLFSPDKSSYESGIILIFALQMSRLGFAYFKLAQGLLAVSGPFNHSAGLCGVTYLVE